MIKSLKIQRYLVAVAGVAVGFFLLWLKTRNSDAESMAVFAFSPFFTVCFIIISVGIFELSGGRRHRTVYIGISVALIMLAYSYYGITLSC